MEPDKGVKGPGSWGCPCVCVSKDKDKTAGGSGDQGSPNQPLETWLSLGIDLEPHLCV